jgi:hypothetical protein
MGTLRSMTDHTGMAVNGLTLGEAVRNLDEDGEALSDSEYRWDDSRLPNGEITSDGEIIVDETELI